MKTHDLLVEDLLDNHRPVPEELLNDLLMVTVAAHEEEAEPVFVHIPSCQVLSLISEILMFREKFGMIRAEDQGYVKDAKPPQHLVN